MLSFGAPEDESAKVVKVCVPALMRNLVAKVKFGILCMVCCLV